MVKFCTLSDIERFVFEVQKEYQNIQGLILSEHDAQCLLFGKIQTHLLSNNFLSIPSDDTTPQIFVSPLHTEIRFLDDNNKLLISPDITILDKGIRLIREPNEREGASKIIKSKGFVFYCSALVIELKFCKNKTGITPAFTRKIEQDCEKIDGLRRLYSENQPETLNGCVIVFSRSNRKCQEFDDLMMRYSNHPVVRILYATAGLNL
ncbi:MAG: hypothetical protein ACKO7W_04845 [Elainella sp.]